MKLLICTHNENKIKEMASYLNNLAIKFVSLKDLNDFEEVNEDGTTFAENALIKAKYFGQKHQIIALADDSGLEVLFLNMAPGVCSHRYERTTKKRNKKLLKNLKGVQNRTAFFTTILALYNPFNQNVSYFEGKVEGLIAKKARGNYGFGYDPVFYLPELDKTMAQISLSEKLKISHRGKALEKLKEYLDENINNI